MKHKMNKSKLSESSYEEIIVDSMSEADSTNLGSANYYGGSLEDLVG